MFVGDVGRLVMDEAEMLRAIESAKPDEDVPLCDGCFYARARRELKSGVPRGAH
jgi:hypothetical protein